jgi:hypothetical protein
MNPQLNSEDAEAPRVLTTDYTDSLYPSNPQSVVNFGCGFVVHIELRGLFSISA